MVRKIKVLAQNSARKEITERQPELDLGIEAERDIDGIGMGVLSDGTPYLNQRGLAALCGVQNAHIGTISSHLIRCLIFTLNPDLIAISKKDIRYYLFEFTVI